MCVKRPAEQLLFERYKKNGFMLILFLMKYELYN
jgi:hypothetical protein